MTAKDPGLYRPASLVVAVAVMIAATVLSVVVYDRSREAVNERARQQLTADVSALGQLYATVRTQSILSAQLLASELPLARGGRADLETYLGRRLDSKSGFVAVTDEAGKVLALYSDGAPVTVAADWAGDTNEPGYWLRNIDGVAHGFAVAAVADSSRRVVTAIPLDAFLGAMWSGESQLVLWLSDAAPVTPALPASQFEMSFVLDASAGLVLRAKLALDPTSAAQELKHLAMVLAGASALAFALVTILVLPMLRRAMRRRWEERMAPLQSAIRRARDGDYDQKVSVKRGSPVASLASDINAMFERLGEREGRIEHQSQFDALTGLANRAVIKERIERAVHQARVAGKGVAVVAIDVSRFNEINGKLGHDIGDQVLKELARRMASNTRVTDTVARTGGDEFMLLLEDADIKLSAHVVEFIVNSLEAPIPVDGEEIKMSLKAGIAMFPEHGDSMKALRRMAGIALMTAKERKRKVVMYEPGQDERHLRELAITHDAPNAIRNNELYLQYQPKIDMETHRVTQVEALVRWRHPQLGFISPEEFIGLLEKAGQIGLLTNWVFKEAIRQCREWNDAGYDLGVAVNISANDLLDDALPERVAALLHHYAVPASRLSIEVTESAVIDEPERAVSILESFRSSGLKIELDDFGTGQTSLSLIKQLPLSQIKIDKSFVQELRADSEDAIIVKSIIDLGHNMGLLVTAEGVESNYCWNLLNSYKCDLVQGYLVSAPLTADELREWYLRLQERHVNKIDYSFIQNAS